MRIKKLLWVYLDWDKAYLPPVVISVVLGLFFIFVWSPLPFGWEGYDGYYDLGKSLAGGNGYPTMYRIWGYPFFLGFFLYIFGDHLWIPLLFQALLNSFIPFLIYRMAEVKCGRRIAPVIRLSCHRIVYRLILSFLFC